KEISLAKNDSRIHGIGRLPKQETAKAEEPAAPAAETSEAAAAEEEKTADDETEAEVKKDPVKENTEDSAGFANGMTYGDSEYVSLGFFAGLFNIARPEEKQDQPAGGNDIDLKQFLDKVEGSSTSYSPPYFETTMKSEFTLPASVASQVTRESGNKLYWDLPEGFLLSDGLLEKGPYTAVKQGTNQPAFYYSFVKNANGTFRVEIQYDAKYAADAEGSDISNSLRFNCSLTEGNTNDNGDIHVEFDKDLELFIPSQEISKDYDIKTEKKGSYIEGENKLVYEVIVSSQNGTPGKVVIHDVLTKTSSEGFLSDPKLISVQKFQGSNQNGVQVQDVKYSFNKVEPEIYDQFKEKWEMNMELEPLGKNEQYVIRYEYHFDNPGENAPISIGNTVKAESSDGKNDREHSSSVQIHKEKKKDIDKSGWVENGRIKWTIRVNESGKDIADKVVQDDMFKEAVEGPYVQLFKDWNYSQTTEGVDYEFVKNN
ncbi:MAG: hypothetical protein HUJ54_14450, partial [Erysipelotrichaceae bacterium]|nr:hypothetical protein [Erysipelotrichaceae bacterium]